MKADTYDFFTMDDWLELIKKFYGQREVFGIILYFRWDAVIW